MKKIIKVLFFFIIPFVKSQTCVAPPEYMVDGGFDMLFGPNKGKVNQVFLNDNLVKFPTKGSEINKSPIIKCETAVLPNGTKIISSRILSITGLPKGLKWSTSKPDNNFMGGQFGCIFITGVPLEKGDFKIQVKVEGFGKFLFVSSRVQCTISNDLFFLRIE